MIQTGRQRSFCCSCWEHFLWCHIVHIGLFMYVILRWSCTIILGVDTLITYSWIMVVSSQLYCISCSVTISITFWDTTSWLVGVACHVVCISACYLLSFASVAICIRCYLFTFCTEFRLVIVLDVIDWGGWDWPGDSALEFIYMYMCCYCFICRCLGQFGRVAGCPSNRRVMPDFL